MHQISFGGLEGRGRGEGRVTCLHDAPALQAPSWIKGSLHLRTVIRDGKRGGEGRQGKG